MHTLTQSCPDGLTDNDLKISLGSRYEEFQNWMNGQTRSICDGRSYNYETKEYEATECASNPHGGVTYSWDVERFLDGRPIID
jgi:hypothetical protein